MAKQNTYTADDVATYFINLSSHSIVGDNDEREGITNLKLQKMLYFAQVYYLVKLGRPLFSDKIEAWKYGPVIPDIYRKYKKNGSNPIISVKNTDAISDEDKEHIRYIWDTFGGYSAGRLVEITHAHNPWKEAYENGLKTITHKALKEYYTPLLTN